MAIYVLNKLFSFNLKEWFIFQIITLYFLEFQIRNVFFSNGLTLIDAGTSLLYLFDNSITFDSTLCINENQSDLRYVTVLFSCIFFTSLTLQTRHNQNNKKISRVVKSIRVKKKFIFYLNNK